ncbi:MAG: hypothetical protein PW843_26940, partial [Azospirillaceae bacterium]|nr:hypothetical protein [Azospirillaceae bacterium]
PGVSQLVVTGAASISGGTVLASLLATGVYLVGSAYTLVQGGAGSSYTGATATVSGVAGLSAVGSISGNTFLLSVSNDYVGGSIGTLSNTGTLSAATAVYIASTGNLGTLVNTGVIQGNVINNSANALTISGRQRHHGGHADGPVGPGHHHQHARQRGAGVRQPGAERRHQCRHRHPGQRRRQRPADQHRLGQRRLQPVGRHLGPWRQPAGGQRCRTASPAAR